MASPLPPYNSTIVVPARTFTRPKDYYMPIPQEVIDESKGVIKQNPNYWSRLSNACIVLNKICDKFIELLLMFYA